MIQLARMFRERSDELQIAHAGFLKDGPTNEAFFSGIEVIKAYRSPSGYRPQTIGWTAAGDLAFGWTVNANVNANVETESASAGGADVTSEDRLQICVDRAGAVTCYRDRKVVEQSTFNEHLRRLPDS